MGENSKKKVLLAQEIEKSGVEYLQQRGYEVVRAPREERGCIRELIRDGEGVMSKTFFLDRETLACAPALRVVGKHGVGGDNVVDVAAASALGICVVNTPRANANSVAEHTIGMILALSKNFRQMDLAVREGDFFAAERMPAHEVREKTLALIGYGNIGKRVAQIAHDGLGMQVIAYDPYFIRDEQESSVRRAAALEEALRVGDYISLHLPGVEKTYHLIGEAQIRQMKPGACLINCARGSVVDTDALTAALKSGRIRAAALDVYEEEPPKAGQELFSLGNVLLTPHSSALSEEALRQMSRDVAAGVDAVLSGKTPEWPVRPVA